SLDAGGVAANAINHHPWHIPILAGYRRRAIPRAALVLLAVAHSGRSAMCAVFFGQTPKLPARHLNIPAQRWSFCLASSSRRSPSMRDFLWRKVPACRFCLVCCSEISAAAALLYLQRGTCCNRHIRERLRRRGTPMAPIL